MDIVYFVRPGDNNEELRYSLRSLKNLPHDTVWIVGYKPVWLKDVKWVPFDVNAPEEVKHKKWWVSWEMMRVACADTDLPDEFIFFNDDFYITKPLDELPVYHRGEIETILGQYRNRSKRSVSLMAMRETKNLLEKLGKSQRSYELHIPMTIDRHKMLTVQEVAEAMRAPDMHFINKRTLYGNYWDIGGRRTNDVKVSTSHMFSQHSTFLSTSDKAFQWKGPRGIQSFLKKAFPYPSPYET